MAGIGFKLKKAFKNKSLYEKSKGFAHAGSVTAGPWLWAVLVLYGIFTIFPNSLSQSSRILISYTILKNLIFSYLMLSPFNLIITRYISDMIYIKSLEQIKPSFYGINIIIIAISIMISSALYAQSPLTLTYKVVAVFLFAISTMTMCIMTYLSSSKDYVAIGMSFIGGGFITILTFVFINILYAYMLPSTYEVAILLTILLGMTVTYLSLFKIFNKTYSKSSFISFDFIRYFRNVPSFALISVLYSLGLWADNLIMWHNSKLITFATSLPQNPSYDVAVVIGFLTIIPSVVLYTVFIETEFFIQYKKFMHKINGKGTLNQINTAHNSMKNSLYTWIFKGFIIQLIITSFTLISIVYISNILDLALIKLSIAIYSIIGFMFLIYSYINLNILLYFDMRKSALVLSGLFLTLNVILTLSSIRLGEYFIGMGFMSASIIVFAASSYMLRILINDTVYIIFSKQNVFK